MTVFMILFVAAQGLAIVGSAYVVARRFNLTNWAVKIGLVIASYFAWVSFTLFAFFWGANSYLVFFGLANTAAFSSLLLLGLWLAAPLLRSRARG